MATTDATVPDNQMTAVIDDDLAGKTLAPGRHYLDSGYLSAALVVAEAARHGIALIGPLLADTSAQARAGHGYARADFTVDYDSKTVDLPAGKDIECPGRRAPSAARTRSWPPSPPPTAVPARPRPCAPPAARNDGSCTVLPRDLAEAQAAARAAETATGFQADYARRAGVEGTKPSATARGAPATAACRKTRLDHLYMACALNLIRLHAYWTGTPLDRRRTSHLARLELGLAA